MNPHVVVERGAESRVGVAECQLELGGPVGELGGEAVPVGQPLP